MKVKVYSTSKHPLPQYATKQSAGLDLRANIDAPITINPRERVLVPTGLHIQLPEGFEARIQPRSGLALKKGITCLNSPGCVDADYRGDVGVILINHGTEPFTVNAGWINDHEIAKGAEILVTRSGGVIPKILSTLSPATQEEQEKLWDEMSECPHCGSSTMWNENHIELCCTNPSCPGVQLAKIIFFYLTCGAENMGEETLSKIFNAGFTSIPAILNVTFNDLIKIEGFGDSISNIILENNRKIMQGVDLATLMQASDCFKGIGKIKAQKILDEMDDEDLCSFCQGWYINHEPDVQSEDFKNCPITVQNLLLGYFPFMVFLEETKIPYKLSPKTAVLEGKCKGLSICVSGFRDSNLEEVITNEGGKIVSGVSKKTTHLVVKDKSTNSSKMSKAKLLGIPILSIEEFYEILNN